jgi:hypothetical protein
MPMSQNELEDLKYAKELLENPEIAARITDALGTAIDKHDFYRSFPRHGMGSLYYTQA